MNLPQETITPRDAAKPTSGRREFLRQAVAGTAVAGTLMIPRAVHAAGDDCLRIGLIGCGGRGSGAAVNAMQADENCKLVAMGDTFADRLKLAQQTIESSAPTGKYAVTEDRCFVGFDAYQHVIAADVDVVILATPPHFRPEHFEAVVAAGKHCFVEKPIAVDVPGVKRVQAACETARQKGLAVVSGLCWRYEPAVVETIRRIQDGAIGELVAIQSAYNTGTLWHRGDKPTWSRMEYQIRNWLYHTWLSGDHIVEQAIHSLDKTAWLNHDASPSTAVGLGGRQQRTGPQFGNIFDHHTVTFEYPTGVKVYFTCRQQSGCANDVEEVVLGTEGKAWIIGNRIEGKAGKWHYEQKSPSMYDVEHQHLFASLRQGSPIHNGDYMCNSTMIAIMGRMASYTGQLLTWDQVTASQEKLGPDSYAWTDVEESPVAIPGITPFV